MLMKRIKFRPSKIILYMFLVALVFITLIPIIYSFFGSFKSNMELMTNGASILPKKFVFENYVQAWEMADFKTYTINSIFLSFFTVVGVVFMSSMVGYVFARGNFPGKNAIFVVFTSTMFISLGTITLYPTIRVAQFLHINTSLWGVVIISVFGTHVTNVFLVRGFINSIPKEIDEAATIDGCGFMGIFLKIMLPLIKPIVATIAILTFKDAWNNYLLPMLFTVGDPKKMPLVVGVVNLKNTGEGATAWNLMLSGMMISVVPMIIVYLCLNRYFVDGLTAGAVKG